MAVKVTDEQRQQVRRALSEAGAKQDTVGAFKDGDLDVLFSNGWDTRAFLLNAQEKHLVACGLSLELSGATSATDVLMSVCFNLRFRLQVSRCSSCLYFMCSSSLGSSRY